MNKYEELARKAIADQQERKAEADAEASERQARLNADEAEKQKYLDTEVLPIVRDAAKGLKSAGIEAEIGNQAASFERVLVLRVGHNRAGRTAHRQSTLTARVEGADLRVDVTTMRGSQGSWKTPKESASTALDPAIEKCVGIWTERNPLKAF